MRHRHLRALCASAFGLLMVAAGLLSAANPAGAAYRAVPGSAGNAVHLAVDCPSGWSLAGEVLSAPAWMTHVSLECARDESGPGVKVVFDVDPLAGLGASGTLVLSLTARDSRGVSVDRTLRRLPFRLAASAPPAQRSYRLEECCLSVAGLEGALDGPPDSPVLLGATPNPWSHRTNIRFGLPAGGSVSLRVLSVGGRLLREFRAPDLEPGYHEISWDGRGPDGTRVPPGIYFYELSSDSWVKTGKTLLLH